MAIFLFIVVVNELAITTDKNIAIFQPSLRGRAIGCDRKNQYPVRIGDTYAAKDDTINDDGCQQVHDRPCKQDDEPLPRAGRGQATRYIWVVLAFWADKSTQWKPVQ